MDRGLLVMLAASATFLYTVILVMSFQLHHFPAVFLAATLLVVPYLIVLANWPEDESKRS